MGASFTRHPFFISQRKNIMVYPIWKEIPIELTNALQREYVVSYVKDGALETIYSGRAYRLPDQSKLVISINDICADWLRNSFPSLVNGFDRQDMPVEFVVQEIDSFGAYKEVARIRFINDWSYDTTHNAITDGLNAPINHRFDARQLLFWTAIDIEEVNAEVTLTNGTSFKVIIPVKITPDFNDDFNVDFAKSLGSAGSGTAVFSPSQWGDVQSISINGVRYDITNTCARYALYYLNAFGGWDSLLIEGTSIEKDALTRYTMNKKGAYDRQTRNYVNEIQKKLTLHTSWLSDEESLRMHHLLNSTDVYIHDLERNEILPVIMDASETPYKTFKNQGGKLVNYTIDVTIAQTRVRR